MKIKGQVSIFIILAILLVALVSLFFAFKDELINNRIPSEISPVYNTLTSCLENDLSLGVSIIESQGGYIYVPDYVSGSEYMPFSSQLNFLGNPIPYWYYVSGNNVEREQVPSKEDMQNQLERFIEGKARECLFDTYYSQGYEIIMKEPNANIDINSNEVVLDLDMSFSVLIDDESYLINEHKIILNSELGSLYDSALEVYNTEQEKLFLENYGIDILRLYAPVDGVEMRCSPIIWRANEIFSELQNAIEANTLALKNSQNKEEYFEIEFENIPSNQKIRFLNSANWSYSFEVLPSEESIMVANPVGNQQGLGILGFCYVPYHFVYNVKYPVLVQVISEEEIFQFPLAVIIQGNQPRKAIQGEAMGMEESELCKDKNTLINVLVYDSNSRPVEADISYECLGTKCNIGITENGKLFEEFPQCINGNILARAEGYKDAEIVLSTIEKGSATIYLTKLYEVPLQIKVNNQNYNKDAVIYFVSDDFSKVVSYPEQKSVELGEGDYEVQVYIYKNSSLQLGATTQKQCVDIPRSSIGGILGLTKEECFDVEMPAQVISNALSGGGKANYSFSDNELKNSEGMEINAESLPSVNSLEQLQDNYILFESKLLEIELK